MFLKITTTTKFHFTLTVFKDGTLLLGRRIGLHVCTKMRCCARIRRLEQRTAPDRATI